MTCNLHTSLASNDVTKEPQPCDTIQNAQRVDDHNATETASYVELHQQELLTCNPGLPHVNIQLIRHANHNP